MTTVSTTPSGVNGFKKDLTIDDVVAWVEAQTKKGDMAESTGRLAATGLRSIALQLADGESHHPQAVYDNMDQLIQRWIRRNPETKGDTARTYASRARGAIKEYLRWDEDPAGYRPRSAKPPAGAGRAEKKTEQPPKKAPLMVVVPQTAPLPSKPDAAPALSPPADHARKVQPGDLRECRLGSERAFQYLLPSDGLKLKDAIRVAYHLITICDDYDPMVSPAQVFPPHLRDVASRGGRRAVAHRRRARAPRLAHGRARVRRIPTDALRAALEGRLGGKTEGPAVTRRALT